MSSEWGHHATGPSHWTEWALSPLPNRMDVDGHRHRVASGPPATARHGCIFLPGHAWKAMAASCPLSKRHFLQEPEQHMVLLQRFWVT
ncbi:hypothetical protein MDA_GLEAN10001638 [Myotis davidii]|uniref:Uncharacterized protein n=1 Tax=Myotis davidii TaxID=225400 RepID=L5LCZ6_MYODS|nr:hypothetical protein MDA_GLEAN10001638 [Myotis davidii]